MTMAETKTLTASQFADKLGTDPKTARRFLRAQGMKVGQGNRHAIPTTSVKRLKAEYTKWAKAQAEAKAAREAEKAKQANPVTDEEIAEETHEDNEPESDTSDEQAEPTVEALSDIEAEEAEEL